METTLTVMLFNCSHFSEMILHRRIGASNPVYFSLGNTFPGDYMAVAQFVPNLACYFSPFHKKSRYLEKLRLQNIHVSGHIDNVYAMINLTAFYLHFTSCSHPDKGDS